MIAPIQLITNSFVVAGTGINAKLWQSDVTPSINAGYTENGVALTWTWQTCLLPDNGQVSENAMVDTASGLQLPPGTAVTITAPDDGGNALVLAAVIGPSGSPVRSVVAQRDAA